MKYVVILTVLVFSGCAAPMMKGCKPHHQTLSGEVVFAGCHEISE